MNSGSDSDSNASSDNGNLVSSETKKNLGFEFKYKQDDYGGVSTLINIINVFDYMKDTKSVEKLKPYLDEEKWTEFIEAKVKHRGYTPQAVTQLVQQKCGYRVTKFRLTDAKGLMNVTDPLIIPESGTHSIAFYEQMIFDALNKTTKKATMENITSYPDLGKTKKTPSKSLP